MMLSLTVGVAGFEPTTPCSQSRCANRTALHPETFEPLVGFEPTTPRLQITCSGQLS